MAERIQLKDPGSELVMTVSWVKPETVERNDYYLFGNGSKEMLVPQSSVKAQFERLNITDVVQMIGKAVRFGRSMKMSRANKPFWDIDWASGDDTTNLGRPSAGGEMGKPTAGTPSAAPSAEPPANRDEAIRALKAKHAIALKQADQYVLDNIVPLFEAKKIGLSDDVIYKHAYTIFQTWEDKGLIE